MQESSPEARTVIEQSLIVDQFVVCGLCLTQRHFLANVPLLVPDFLLLPSSDGIQPLFSFKLLGSNIPYLLPLPYLVLFRFVASFLNEPVSLLSGSDGSRSQLLLFFNVVFVVYAFLYFCSFFEFAPGLSFCNVD